LPDHLQSNSFSNLPTHSTVRRRRDIALAVMLSCAAGNRACRPFAPIGDEAIYWCGGFACLRFACAYVAWVRLLQRPLAVSAMARSIVFDAATAPHDSVTSH
jgi:hypothetical protein